MPEHLGAHSKRLKAARDLLTVKRNRKQERFLVEGPTLLAEARASSIEIEEIYATRRAYERTPQALELEASGIPLWIVDERTIGRLSDVESPTGIVAVAHRRVAELTEVFAGNAPTLVLADLNDPGNCGTLVRSADAFGASGVVFGQRGVDPYHPKVVRAAMGSLFRLPVAVAAPAEVQEAAKAAGRTILGLAAEGTPLEAGALAGGVVILVGHERHGLGPWEIICASRVAIRMRGGAESLNAAVAGSIALYEAGRRPKIGHL